MEPVVVGKVGQAIVSHHNGRRGIKVERIVDIAETLTYVVILALHFVINITVKLAFVQEDGCDNLWHMLPSKYVLNPCKPRATASNYALESYHIYKVSIQSQV